MHIRNLLGAVSVILAGVLCGDIPAYAQVLAVASLEGTYTQLVNTSSWQAIAVRTGGTGLQFKTTQNNETVVITYSGTCLALGFTVSVRANIDGVIGNPGSKNGVALCFTTVSGSAYPASRTFSAVIATKGTHNLTIEVKGSTNAGISVGDSALIIQQ